jgi:hypothetical protein
LKILTIKPRENTNQDINSEITNTLKIKDIKQKLQENQERTIIFNSTATEQINKEEQENSPSVSKQFENIAKELLKPTYTSSPEDELLKKKNENLDKMENQEHNQNNGLELLKKVIETNERNIEQGIKTEFVYEDLLNIKGETESTMRRFNATILKLSESLEKEAQERNEFIERIPKTIEIRPSEDYLNLNKAFEKNSKFMKISFMG